MPINYQNSIIYKFVCNDLKITECYVGSTCNFRRRKCQHKSSCNNEDSKKYNYNIYTFIRENGGWSNWTMVPIFKYTECKDKMDLLIMEGEYIKELKATLNDRVAGRTKKQRYQNNKTRIVLKNKQYNEDNKLQIKTQRKCFREQNKERLNIQMKHYYQKNKEHIKLKASQKITCVCGSIITKSVISHHKKTKKHLNFIADYPTII